MSEYIVVCESLSKADSLMNYIMSNVAPRTNFGVDYYHHTIGDRCGDTMRFVSNEDVNTRHVLQGFRGPVMYEHEVKAVINEYFYNYRAIRRLAALHVIIEGKRSGKNK